MRGGRRAGVLAAAALALVGCSPAFAAAGLEIGMEDERLLLAGGAEAEAAVAAWAATGVDSTRIHARWSEIAPARRPPGFDAFDPGDPAYRWDTLDRAVGLARGAGLRVMLTVTGPGPPWTSRAPARRNPRYKPDARAFAAFARAVARRYGGEVDRYLIWNEPNQPGWLEPQLGCRRGGRDPRTRRRPRDRTGARLTGGLRDERPARQAPLECTPVAPHLYRELVAAALPAIKAADPGAEVVIGELAPIGRELTSVRAPIAPLPFLRAMACVDERYRPLPRTGACARFAPPYADAIGHHPHGVLSAPDQPSQDPGWAKIADLGRLVRVLDRLVAAHRMIAPEATGGRYELHLTEFGYQTSPPDHVIGVSLARQAAYLQQAAYLAWSNPRVRSLVHYQWIDEPVRYRAPGPRAYAGWQSGLHYINGKAKPALQGFEAPFVADLGAGSPARFWGQVRPGGAHTVTLLLRSSSGEFLPVAEAQTDERGYWTQEAPAGSGEFRFSWTEPAVADPPTPARTRTSGVVVLGGRSTTRIRAASASAG